MLSLFQADITWPRGQSFDRPPFETQIFSLLAAWHSHSHADLAHIRLREQLSDIVRSLAAARRAMRSAMLIFQGNFVLDLA
jgi:hypothetical protein